MTISAFAVDRYSNQIREKVWPGVMEDDRYRYFDTESEAVTHLIERQEAGILALEKKTKSARTRLRAFMKKHHRT